MKKNLPIIAEALEFRLDQYGWTKSKMAKKLGLSPSHYNQILKGEEKLLLAETRKAYKIGVPASVLLQ